MGKSGRIGKRLKVNFTQRRTPIGQQEPGIPRRSLRERLREVEQERDRFKAALESANQNTLRANRVVDRVIAMCATADQAGRPHVTTSQIRKMINEARAAESGVEEQ